MEGNPTVIAATLRHEKTVVELSISTNELQTLLQTIPAATLQAPFPVAMLLETVVAKAKQIGLSSELERNDIWWQEKNGRFYHGKTQLPKLTPIEDNLMQHFWRHPYKRHTHTDLIHVGWPEIDDAGITTDCLYHAIATLRQKIEPTPQEPRHIINWRGRPEGGYLFNP